MAVQPKIGPKAANRAAWWQSSDFVCDALYQREANSEPTGWPRRALAWELSATIPAKPLCRNTPGEVASNSSADFATYLIGRCRRGAQGANGTRRWGV